MRTVAIAMFLASLFLAGCYAAGIVNAEQMRELWWFPTYMICSFLGAYTVFLVGFFLLIASIDHPQR